MMTEEKSSIENRDIHSLKKDLIQLRRTMLPKGGLFVFKTWPHGLELKLLRVPASARGVGTSFFSNILALADKYGIPSFLTADPTDEPGDPGTLDLMRWYSRFGFVAVSCDDNGVRMTRDIQTVCDAHTLACRARNAKKNDASDEVLSEWLEKERAKTGLSPQNKRRSYPT